MSDVIEMRRAQATLAQHVRPVALEATETTALREFSEDATRLLLQHGVRPYDVLDIQLALTELTIRLIKRCRAEPEVAVLQAQLAQMRRSMRDCGCATCAMTLKTLGAKP